MFFLILLWLLIGLALGLLFLPAGFSPRLKRRWLWLPLIGMGSGLLAGFLGLWVLGRDTATALVFWLPVIILLLLPRLFAVQTGKVKAEA